MAWQLPSDTAAPANGSSPIDGKYLAFSLPQAPAVQLGFPDGRSVQLTCKTGGALACILEVSNELRTWVPLWTNTLPARLELGLIDPHLANQPARFYRAVMQ